MAYLTQAEYLERYTTVETIRITDEEKAGVVDTGKLDAALADATDFAESYLLARYTVPVSPAPEILKGIVGDLARERLHKTKPTQAVTENADRARALLRDLSAGRASIAPNGAGLSPPENPSGDPMSSGDARRRVFTESAMCEYTDLGYSFGGTVFNSGPRGW